VLSSIRGMLFMSGVAGFYGLLDAIRPGDLAFFRVVMASLNTASMFGCFVLARSLSGSFVGGLLGLVLAASYPSFAVQTPRLYPDPLTGCLFVWSAVCYRAAIREGSRKWMIGAGLLLSAGLFVRSQIIDYMLLVLALCLTFSAPLWLRKRGPRRLALAFILSLLPLCVVWGLTRWAVGNNVDPLVQLGNETFKPYYPYGFWQYLETDGWIGPYRLKTEPYAQALQAATQADPALLRSFPRQLLFTARYVLHRPWESLLLVLDNAYRLYDRPANDYKWDYPFPYTVQVWAQRVVCLLAVAGIALFVSEESATAGVFLIPLAIAVLHGLVFPWPRYNLPAMPILLAAAGAFLGRVLQRPSALRGRGVPTALLLGALALVLGRAASLGLPEAARLCRILGALALLFLPFLLTARLSNSARGRVWAGFAFFGLAALSMAHMLRDRLWHQTEAVLGGKILGIEQEIRLSATALERLRSASQAFLVFDLAAPGGSLEGVSVEWGGETLPGSRLIPTMPKLPESTTRGGRDWHGYPQWWALPIDPQTLPNTELLRVKILSPDTRVILKGDRFTGQERWYEGPSFGDWPYAVGLKLEYDADYRLTVRMPLASERTQSYEWMRGGGRMPSRTVYRIRLVTLSNNEGFVGFESAPLPSGPAALGFFAYSGRRDRAELILNGRRLLSFPLGSPDGFALWADPFRLCYRGQNVPKAGAYGAYFLDGPLGVPGRPASLAVHFETGMSLEPMYFVVDPRPGPADLVRAYSACSSRPMTVVNGAARVLDASKSFYPDSNYSWIKVALGSVIDSQQPAPGSFRWSVSGVF
jgi:4-amino-4-deoxy-L-arabinose transferase-like glycosyltransferase